MSESKTRFQKICQTPQNVLDKDIKEIADYLVEEKRFEELAPIRDYFNRCTDKAYEWHVRTLEQIISLDTVSNNIDDAIKNHLKSLAGPGMPDVAKAIAEGMAEMVVVIAPWHGELRSLNNTMQSINAKIYGGISRPEELLLKDTVIDKLERKLYVIQKYALKAAKDMIPEFKNKQVVLNEETYRYEII